MGKCLLDLLAPEAASALTSNDPYLALDNKAMATMSFSNLSVEEQDHYSAKLMKHSSISFTNSLTYPGYEHVRSLFAVSANDNAVPPGLQRQLVDDANQKRAQIEVVELQSDHCPMLSHPDEVVDLLMRFARG